MVTHEYYPKEKAVAIVDKFSTIVTVFSCLLFVYTFLEVFLTMEANLLKNHL